MVTIKRQLVSNARKLTSSGRNRKLKVCVHDTGNTSAGAHAQAHANLQAGGNSRAASWHWQVDDKEAIQSYRHNDRCWHAANATGNAESIAVEICVNSDGDYAKALANAAELVAKILKDEGRSVNDVTTHNGYSGADCPRQLRNSRDGISWNDFIGMVREAFGGSTPSAPKSSGSSSSGGSSKSVSQLAQEVIDGRHGTGDARKRALGSQYNAVQAEVNRRLGAGSSSSSSGRKSTAQLAKEVIDGRHGSGDARKRALGSRYNEVQAEVNRRLGAGSSSSRPAQKSTAQLAQEVIDGRHGSGDARKRALGSRYNAVQAEVNRRLGGGRSTSTNVRLSVDQVARQIVNGQGNWGNDPGRSQKLRAAGYDAAAVQRRVNQLL